MKPKITLVKLTSVDMWHGQDEQITGALTYQKTLERVFKVIRICLCDEQCLPFSHYIKLVVRRTFTPLMKFSSFLLWTLNITCFTSYALYWNHESVVILFSIKLKIYSNFPYPEDCLEMCYLFSNTRYLRVIVLRWLLAYFFVPSRVLW